eukprot:CAMPEP_0115145094 /NCGR_PEP_ID=MMETSP0227-20121206/61915_1 /TAXON_ID=89957 /ORGANISM="Polarella glacialis, Strain CCMP 1383" /LENGTH=181 /DNA_ID=CAMNT_0002554555 /DNA_START=273 /DNA_END=819 /DNA_ORIENTATION=-
MADVRLVRRHHQWLRATHPHLNLSDSTNFNGISQGSACTVALPARGLWGRHPGFTDRAGDDLFLRWAIRSCEARTSPVLPNLGGPEYDLSISFVRSILQEHAACPLTAEDPLAEELKVKQRPCGDTMCDSEQPIQGTGERHKCVPSATWNSRGSHTRSMSNPLAKCVAVREAEQAPVCNDR